MIPLSALSNKNLSTASKNLQQQNSFWYKETIINALDWLANDQSVTAARSLTSSSIKSQVRLGTAAAAPPTFRLGDPALCGSHLLVTP